MYLTDLDAVKILALIPDFPIDWLCFATDSVLELCLRESLLH